MAEPITQVLGIVGIKNRGEYNSETTYEKLNTVRYQGQTYCAKTDTQGNLPTDTDYWDLMVEKGEKGDKPVKGVDYYTPADKAEIEADLSADVTAEVTNQLSDLTSATPLVASSTSGMTDTSRIYVNTTDGHWYWYNGTTWNDGGTYQATEDPEVVDIRTGYDGTTYTDAGASVRSQITAIRSENKYLLDSVNEDNLRLMNLDGNYYLSEDMFERGNIAINPSISPDLIYNNGGNRVRIKKNITIKLKKNMKVSISSGKFYSFWYDEEGTLKSRTWAGQILIPENGDYTFLLRYDPESEIINISDITSLFKIERISTDKSLKEEVTILSEKIDNIGNVLKLDKYYDHLFLNKTNGSNVIVPLQSLSSIFISKRLGFRIIEANVRKTSDNKYIVTHGVDGKFGNYFEHIDGVTDISNTLISSVTLAYIKNNIRFKSLYDKYKTAPPTLEEYLYTCKKLEMIPLVQIENDENVTEIANKIIGKDNYIAYNSNRSLNNGWILRTGSLTTKESILELCEQYKPPFIYFMMNPTSFTDNQLKDIIETLHENNYLLGIQDTFVDVPYINKMINLGFDIVASTYNVNDFEHGNITDSQGDIDFSDFEGNGTVVENNYVLTTGQYIRKWSPQATFLSKSVIYIKFDGSLRVNLHNNYRGNVDISSDGTEYFRISLNTLNLAPKAMFTALENTTIYELIVKSSKC